ncbi:MAG: alkyl hydroperoxide reductase/Thiol specific antioxidant/Mal allergen [Acidobacteria bacterium]|nr:alkyl hydroperoxide reductase/Thiol specific antioxidant/Mal allergen [Acidobacteriota bacterium]
MKKQRIFSLALAAVLLLAGAVMAGSGRTDEAALAAPAIGSAVEDFSLLGTDGSNHTLSSLRGKNGSVLIFISVQCPVSNGYNERMEALAQAYGKRGINVIGINSNATENADAVKAHAAEKHFTFAVLKDAGNKIADKLGAARTPEAYLLDANNKLVYHGRIDNSKDESQVNSTELRDAMDALLAGKPIVKTTAMAFGCSIKRA